MTPDLRSPPPALQSLRLAAALALALSTLAAAPWAAADDASPSPAAAPAKPSAAAVTSPAAGDAITIESPGDSAAASAPAASSSSSSDSSAASGELADTQDKLATALRSYSLLQDENTQLKAAADKSAADQADLVRQLDEARATIATLQAQAAAATQVAPLQSQVLEARDEGSRLATENAALRTQLALQAPAPGADHPAPTRPGLAPDALPGSPASSAPAAAPESAPTEATAPAAERSYTVVEGDTLGKIALKFYGAAAQWPKILAANHTAVPNENSLPVGAVLKIP